MEPGEGRGGNRGIKEWIGEKMAEAEAVVVLVGSETAGRHWVRHEIQKAWEDGKPLLGVRIHGLASEDGTAGEEGEDPFGRVEGVDGVPVFDPTQRGEDGEIDTRATYDALAAQLESWSGQGVTR